MTFTSTPFWPLIQTVFESILEVFILCIAGFFLARQGVLDKKTQKQINRLNVSLFTPSLLFSKVAFFLSPQKLRELWIIPIFFVIVTLTSMTVAFSLSFLFRLKHSQKSFAVAASMFMNSNSLPIALMQSLVVTVPGLKWEEDDDKDVMLGRALTYLVLYSTLGMIVRWSYGVRLLSQADPEEDLQAETEESHPLLFEDPLLHNDALPEDRASLDSLAPSTVGARVPDTYLSPHRENLHVERPRVFYSFPNTPATMSVVKLPEDGVDATTDSGSDDFELPGYRPITEPSQSELKSRLRRARRRIVKACRTFNEFMTIPLWASLASLVVACTRPLQHALEMHMQPVKGALTSAGNCSIPLTLVVLGAYFYTPALKEDENRETLRTDVGIHPNMSATRVSLIGSVRDMFEMSGSGRSGKKRASTKERPGETRTVVIAVVSRMIITPLLLLPLIAVSAKYDWQAVFADPVFVVANVLLISSPPALTLAQITQAASGDAFERLISRTIFWAYCLLTPFTTVVYVVIGLVFANL